MGKTELPIDFSETKIYNELALLGKREQRKEDKPMKPVYQQLREYREARGNLFEPIARSEFERVYNKKVNQVGWVEMENEISGISPDGLIGEFEAIEIKCPARKKHMS